MLFRNLFTKCRLSGTTQDVNAKMIPDAIQLYKDNILIKLKQGRNEC